MIRTGLVANLNGGGKIHGNNTLDKSIGLITKIINPTIQGKFILALHTQEI